LSAARADIAIPRRPLARCALGCGVYAEEIWTRRTHPGTGDQIAQLRANRLSDATALELQKFVAESQLNRLQNRVMSLLSSRQPASECRSGTADDRLEIAGNIASKLVV
jgi:hypothetical protein